MSRPSPLAARTVAVTAGRAGARLAVELRACGAEVLAAPTVSLVPAPSRYVRRETAAMLAHEPVGVLLTTGEGLRRWVSAVGGRAEPLLLALDRTHLAARGAKAAAAARSHGLMPRLVHPRGAALADLLLEQAPPGSIGVQVDGGGSAAVVDRLARAGRLAGVVAPYRWTLPDDRGPAEALVRELLAGAVDVVVFTSVPAVNGLADIAAGLGCGLPLTAALQRSARVAAIGSSTAEAAERHGWPVTVTPLRPSVDGLVAAVASAATDGTLRSGPVVALDHDRRIAVVDGRPVELTATEFALLAALVRRWGALCPTDVLLRELWRTPCGTRRRLQAHVSRLRARLAASGLQIVAVPKRGYCLHDGAGTGARRSAAQVLGAPA